MLQQALQDGYLTDAAAWAEMKKSRELTSHTYNKDTADSIAQAIYDSYHALLDALRMRLEKEL